MAKIQKSTKKFLQKKLKQSRSGAKKPDKPFHRKKRDEAKEDVLEEGPEESDESDEQLETAGFMDVQSSESDSDLENESQTSDHESDIESDIDSDNESVKMDMTELKEKDPKFYQFLLENDQNLLQFDPSQDDDDISAADLDTDNVVTKEMIHHWRAQVAHNYSIKAYKKIVLAFRAAAAFGDDDQETGRYRVADEQVFNLVLLSAIKYAPLVFQAQLFGKEDEERKGLPSSSKKWKKVSTLVKSFLSSLLKILHKMTSLSMTKYVIKTSEGIASYFACFPKLAKDFNRDMLQLWATSPHEQVRILAFLCIRKLCIVAPNPYLDITIKASWH